MSRRRPSRPSRLEQALRFAALAALLLSYVVDLPWRRS